MRAIVVTRPGGPEVLEVVERPLPQPGKGEVRVRVGASGLNRADLLQREGKYPAPPGWPADIPGLEFAGVIEALGEEAEAKVGDRVMGIVGGGGYAEAVVLPARQTVPIPAALDVGEAGAVAEVFMTAYDALFRQMRLALGESVLLHSVGSGVGTAAVQLAHAAGARVIGTSRTEDKIRRAAELGLHYGVVVRDGGWADAVLEITGGRGVDVLMDLVGAPYLEGNQRVLATGGRMIVVGTTAGPKGEIDLRALMGRRATLVGTVMRARSPEEKVALARDFAAYVVPLFENATLRPVVDRYIRPEQIGEAHRSLTSNDTFGKIVILWE